MVPDQVIFLLVQENIELACQAIEKAAMDRAVIDVDEGFATAYEIRRRHREVSNCRRNFGEPATEQSMQSRPGQPFWDSSVPQSNVFGSLPDPLRIKPNGVHAIQTAVYEDFSESFLCTFDPPSDSDQAWMPGGACSPAGRTRRCRIPATTKWPPSTALRPPPPSRLGLPYSVLKRPWSVST